jgi:hypothetical protein
MIDVIEVFSEEELTAEVFAAVQEAITNLYFKRYRLPTLEVDLDLLGDG